MPKLPTLLVPGSLSAPGAEPGETPIAFIQRWLRTRMPEYGGHDASLANRVLVVQARTGSGKSTVLPVAVLRILRAKETPARVRLRGPGVICTQPRVLTAIALASDVAADHSPWNSDMVLGETLGFQTGPVSNAPPAGLVYATAGVLAAQLQAMDDGEFMGRYRFIIVDEAHERAVEIDLMLMLLRALYVRNAGDARLPFLILASATFVPARYAEYFGVGAANVVDVKGSAYETVPRWPARGTNDYVAAAAEAVLRIHADNPDDPPERADVLVFVPGSGEARAVVSRLIEAQGGLGGPGDDAGEGESKASGTGPPRPFLVLTLNREVVASQAGDYPLVFAPPARLPRVGGRPPARRVVVSTVVAETGLTIDTLRYVVDCGWSRTREVYQPWGVEGLVTRPAPQSRVWQRRGRAGRLFDGEFHPLYTENVFRALDPLQPPDIVTCGCAEVFLALVAAQQRRKVLARAPPAEFRAEDLGLLDPPPPEAFLAASATATLLGFVSARAPLPAAWPPAALAAADAAAGEPGLGPLTPARGWGLTALGHLGALFARTPMEGVRVLLAGYAWGAAASDLVTAVAMFGTPPARLLLRRGRPPPGAPPAPPGAPPPGAEALRAALPPFLARRAEALGGGAGARVLPPAASELFFYRARLLLADDFAEAALVFAAFARRVDEARGDLAAVEAWCEGLGLSYEALLELARRRAEVAEDLLVAGLSPFRGEERALSALPPGEFVAGLVGFKRCLYDGLRSRLLRFEADHPDGPAYVTRQGLRVRVPPLLPDAAAARLRALGAAGAPGGDPDRKPRWVLADQVRLVPPSAPPGAPPPPLLYGLEANLVSVLDGYVDPDPDLGDPRTFPAPHGAGPPGEGAAAMEAKYGPPEPDLTPTPGEASARLEAYARASRAALLAADGPVAPPILGLTDAQLTALFTPGTAEKLVRQPFGRLEEQGEPRPEA